MAAWDWKILADRVSKLRADNAGPLHGLMLFVIQHVLDDLLLLLKGFIELGCDPEDIWVIGIPYSSRPAAAEAIRRDLGCRVELPRLFPFEGCVCALLMAALDRAKQEKKRMIILEDGGYTVPLVPQLAEVGCTSHELILGAVEQTTRGVRMDRQVMQSGNLPFPVISIPDCETKKTVEPPYIAEAVILNLSHLLRVVDPDLDPARIKALGMFGYGTIGDRVAKTFSNKDVRIYVEELSPERRYSAYVRSRYQRLTETALGECDLVLGTTGSTSIGQRVFTHVKDGAILASTSSRQVEIDMEWLSGHSSEIKTVESYGPCTMPLPAGRRYDYLMQRGNKSVTVLYDGYPLNFWDRSLPDHVGDAILSLLLEGVAAIAEGRLRQPNVYKGCDLLPDADMEISLLWQREKPQDGIDPFAW
jgi:adenosylhomocysteinase